MEFTTSIAVNGESVIPDVPYGSRAYRLANSIYCPVGPSPTRAYLLLLKSSIDTLAASSASAVSIAWNQKATDKVYTYDLTFQGLYFVKAERLLVGGQGDEHALYLAEFADARWLSLKRAYDTGTAIIGNQRSYANTSDYLTGASGYTWTSLATALWNACSLLGSWPGLPYSPDSVPEGGYYTGHVAYKDLTALLDNLDCAIKHNPLTNTYTIVQLGDTQTVPTHQARLKFDAEPPNLNAFQNAANIKVYWNNNYKGYGQERDNTLATNWLISGAVNSSTVATSITGASGTKPLWDDMPYMIDEDGANSNAAALSTRATARKTRYVTRHSVAPAHKVFSGLLRDLLPGAKVRAVLWRNWSDSYLPDGRDNPLGGTCTEYIQGNDLSHGLRPDSTNQLGLWIPGSDALNPSNELYSSPDISRRSFPNYPSIADIVQVNAASGSAGDVVAPDANGYFKGRVKRWVNGAMVSMDDCWLKFIDYYDTDTGQIYAVQGNYYGPARLSGIETSGGTTRPVYLAKLDDGQTFLVQRTTNLAKGSSGSFKLYHTSSETDSGFTKSAKALGVAYVANKWATIQRINGIWYSGCYEP